VGGFGRIYKVQLPTASSHNKNKKVIGSASFCPGILNTSDFRIFHNLHNRGGKSNPEQSRKIGKYGRQDFLLFAAKSMKNLSNLQPIYFCCALK
jgi:hypothetical protein